ncbi:hypothetical protein ADUPG1_010277, partial [Aduncisulcus paluster]
MKSMFDGLTKVLSNILQAQTQKSSQEGVQISRLLTNGSARFSIPPSPRGGHEGASKYSTDIQDVALAAGNSPLPDGHQLISSPTPAISSHSTDKSSSYGRTTPAAEAALAVGKVTSRLEDEERRSSSDKGLGSRSTSSIRNPTPLDDVLEEQAAQASPIYRHSPDQIPPLSDIKIQIDRPSSVPLLHPHSNAFTQISPRLTLRQTPRQIQELTELQEKQYQRQQIDQVHHRELQQEMFKSFEQTFMSNAMAQRRKEEEERETRRKEEMDSIRQTIIEEKDKEITQLKASHVHITKYNQLKTKLEIANSSLSALEGKAEEFENLAQTRREELVHSSEALIQALHDKSELEKELEKWKEKERAEYHRQKTRQKDSSKLRSDGKGDDDDISEISESSTNNKDGSDKPGPHSVAQSLTLGHSRSRMTKGKDGTEVEHASAQSTILTLQSLISQRDQNIALLRKAHIEETTMLREEAKKARRYITDLKRKQLDLEERLRNDVAQTMKRKKDEPLTQDDSTLPMRQEVLKLLAQREADIGREREKVRELTLAISRFGESSAKKNKMIEDLQNELTVFREFAVSIKARLRCIDIGQFKFDKSSKKKISVSSDGREADKEKSPVKKHSLLSKSSSTPKPKTLSQRGNALVKKFKRIEGVVPFEEAYNNIARPSLPTSTSNSNSLFSSIDSLRNTLLSVHSIFAHLSFNIPLVLRNTADLSIRVVQLEDEVSEQQDKLEKALQAAGSSQMQRRKASDLLSDLGKCKAALHKMRREKVLTAEDHDQEVKELKREIARLKGILDCRDVFHRKGAPGQEGEVGVRGEKRIAIRSAMEAPITSSQSRMSSESSLIPSLKHTRANGARSVPHGGYDRPDWKKSQFK